MDILSDIFETAQLKGTFYFRTDFSPPWGATVPRYGRAARFHYVVQGSCWIRVEDADPVELREGDFILVPRGASHVLADQPTESAPPLEQVMRAAGYAGEPLLAVGHGDPSASTQLVCGHFTFREGADHPVLRVLPPLIKIGRRQRQANGWFEHVLDLLVRLAFDNMPGSIAAITRLSEILFLEAIRLAGDQSPELKRLLDGFADPRIGRAIALMHRTPGQDWTVDTLAREVGMSRTRFADLFQELIGTSPGNYLLEWRLQQAAIALSRTRRSIGEIAGDAGYRSQASFTRAFKQLFGRSPRLMRESERG